MKITAPLFEAFLKCSTKCYLRSLGETGSGNEYAKWVRRQGESDEVEAVKRLQGTVPEGERIVTPLISESFKTAKWRLALNVVVQSPGRGADSLVRESLPNDETRGLSGPRSGPELESRLHAVERVPSEGRGKPAQFIPIRFIYRNKLTNDDKPLLGFDALVLSEMLGREVNLGKIIHGDDHATLNVKLGALTAESARTRVTSKGLMVEVRKRLEKITSLLSGEASPRSADGHVRESRTDEETRGLSGPRSVPAPDLVLNRHCAECEFQARCRKLAVEKDDLSLLAGMSAKERQKIRSKGIFTVTQLSYTFRPRRRPRRQRDKREKYHHALKALAIREQKIHIVGSPELKIEGTPVYLDVEGLPDRDFYYLIGLRIGSGESAVQHSLWADTVADEGKIWWEFLAILETADHPVLVHYGSFETTFMKEMRDRHGDPQDESVAGKAIASALNLVSVIFGKIYFPTFSNGLKEIACWLGYQWTDNNSSGLRSICWRHEWEQTTQRSSKEKLHAYNLDDCAALEQVVNAVLQVCLQTPVLPTNDRPGLEIAHADTLSSLGTMWPKFASPIDAFESINKAGRWDYQRNRIYIRTDEELRRTIQAQNRRPKKPVRVSKAVICEPPCVCPRCQKKGGQMIRTITKRLHDLKFSKSGVKGWVVKYQFQVFRCTSCCTFIPWPREFWDRTQYGRNLAAFSIFEIIDLCISQRSVTQTLNRLFGFHMNENVVRRFKASGAEYYEETRTKILASIVKGNLIHADETRIILRGKAAYVWVFATFREVVFFYSETREGDLLKTLLERFNGVLVSDFYAAYDSMPCEQQKCLLHLMRDLNDAVLDHPFDEEVKGIVTQFGEILRSIVATIDRRGLKRHFLRKHGLEVERFYRRMRRTTYQSEAALKCKERFEKNREKLFTFLNHDGVPWNNNNVEHGIKAFARLRRAIEGLSTPKGIEEYLILLSICQTRKYMGVDFLDFLRSGEKDIHAFAESRCGRRRRTQPSQPTEPPPNTGPNEVGGA